MYKYSTTFYGVSQEIYKTGLRGDSNEQSNRKMDKGMDIESHVRNSIYYPRRV